MVVSSQPQSQKHPHGHKRVCLLRCYRSAGLALAQLGYVQDFSAALFHHLELICSADASPSAPSCI